MKTSIKFNNDAIKKTFTNAVRKSNFNLKCPNCKNNVSFTGNQIGGSVICPNCKTNIVLNDNQKINS